MKILLGLVLLAIGFEVAQGGKILKKLTKELKKVLGGSKFEDYVKDNLDNIAMIADNVANFSDHIEHNSDKIHYLAEFADNATRCTAVNWDYDCCTSANPCSIGQGDCNSTDHTTCSGDLKCGIDNCLSEFGFGISDADCCILVGIHDNAMNIANIKIDLADNAAAISSIVTDVSNNAAGVSNNAAAISSNDADILSISNDVAEATRCTAVDWIYSCCTSANPCSLGKGDCDENDDSTCSGDLKCGANNCLSDFGFGYSDFDCCFNPDHNVVWFEAYRTNTQTVSGYETITYQGLEGSVGSGMNAPTGIFTAPEDGVYEFHVQAYKWNPNGNQSLGLYKNSVIISFVRDEDGDKKTSLFMTAITDLVAGDQVWVTANINVYGSSYRLTKFTGVKI